MVAPVSINDPNKIVQVTASITLDATHKGKLLVNDTSSNFTLTIPDDAATNYPIGTEIAFEETNTGRLQLLSTVGVTVKDIGGVAVVFPHEVPDLCLIRKTAANTWLLEASGMVRQSTIAIFTNTVDFDSPLKVYATRTVSTVEAFTVGALGKVSGARVIYRLIADGVNAPIFAGFKRQGNQDYLNFAGAVNTIEFIYDGVDSIVRVSHENPFAGTPFRFTVNTAAAAPTNRFRLPLNAAYAYDFYIAWGDGTFERYRSNATLTHLYATPANYTISIWGQFPAIRFNNSGDRLKMLAISQWGTSVEWLSMAGAFSGCNNMTFSTTSIDNNQARTGKVQDWSYAFLETLGATTFPLIDVSGGVDFTGCWLDNGVISFPLLDFTNGRIFINTWASSGVPSMTSFAPRSFPSGEIFQYAWGRQQMATFLGFSAPNARSLLNAWLGCNLLTSWSANALPNCQVFNTMLDSCTLLTSFSIGETPVAASMDGMLAGTKVATFPGISLNSVTSFTLMLNGNTFLTSFLGRNIRSSISFLNCNLSAAAIDTVFSNLATLPVANSQTITVTGNPGAATCTQSIATAKGWLVVA